MEETLLRRRMQAEKRKEEKSQQEDDEAQHILTQLPTRTALEETEKERTRKEEADDKRRQDEQNGWGLTNHTIKQEGINYDEIAQVLKKKTHDVIPVIASDQIATLLPLVNHTTKQFGFVINSQSEEH